jgi:hypothetical protein
MCFLMCALKKPREDIAAIACTFYRSLCFSAAFSLSMCAAAESAYASAAVTFGDACTRRTDTRVHPGADAPLERWQNVRAATKKNAAAAAAATLSLSHLSDAKSGRKSRRRIHSTPSNAFCAMIICAQPHFLGFSILIVENRVCERVRNSG